MGWGYAMNEQQHTAESDAPDLYICPTSGETESRTMGGFDVCCDHPRCPGNLYGTRVTSPESTPR